MARIFQWTFPVPEDAIDALGHVNNLRYLAWMQDVAIAHSTLQGWPLSRYLAEGHGWVVQSHAIKYLRPAFAGQSLSLLTWVADMQHRHSLRKFLFLRQADGKILAEAETNWVFVDLASGRPVQVPDTLTTAFDIVTDPSEVAAFQAGLVSA